MFKFIKICDGRGQGDSKLYLLYISEKRNIPHLTEQFEKTMKKEIKEIKTNSVLNLEKYTLKNRNKISEELEEVMYLLL